MSGSPGPATSFVVPLASQGAPCVVSPTASFSGMSRMAPAAAASATKTQLLQGAPAAAVPAAVAMQTMNIDLSNPQTAAARMLGEPSCSGRMEPKDQLLAPHARQRHEQYHIEPVYDPYKTHKLLFSGGKRGTSLRKKLTASSNPAYVLALTSHCTYPCLCVSVALSGAISRTVTAPVDRLKMILQVQDDSKRGMTLREGVQRMHSEGRHCSSSDKPHRGLGQQCAQLAQHVRTGRQRGCGTGTRLERSFPFPPEPQGPGRRSSKATEPTCSR